MLREFYDTVLPHDGHYALMLMGNPPKHQWSDTVFQLVAQTEEHIAAGTQGVYFAAASYEQRGSRKQDNVLALRSLRLDIDAGEHKFASNPKGAYPTQQDALAALIEFSKLTKLVPTYIVSSGEGLHVYYALDEDVSPAVWAPVAKRLGQHCKVAGFRVDSTTTNDTARVLRPPGTLHKNGKRVTILKDTGKVYGVREIYDLLGAVKEEDFGLPVSANRRTGINDDVTAVVGPPKSIWKIIPQCPAMNEVAASRGDVQEPLWRAMIGIAKFTIEGEDAAQELSNGYEGYDPDEVTAKYEAWHTGPTTCEQFNQHTDACDSCPHKGKIRSPIVLGAMTVAQIEKLPDEKQEELATAAEPTRETEAGKPWEGKLPDKFFVQKIKGHDVLVHQILIEKEGEGGEKIPMMINVPFTFDIFWLGTWAEAAGDGDTAQVFVHRYDNKTGRVQVLTMEQGLVASRHDMFKWLGEKSIHHTTHKKAPQAMEDYIRSSLEQIKRMGRRPKINDRFGIRILDDGRLAAAHGSRLLLPDGTIENGVLEEKLRGAAVLFDLQLPASDTGEWSPDVWPAHIQPRAARYAAFMRDSYAAQPKFALAGMLALASPLMPFVTGAYQAGLALPPNGLSVSLVSRFGGKGKSGLAQAVMLAYGSPTLAKDGGQNGSTDLARISKLSMWGTMPLSLEEMGNTKEQSVANLISSIANGSGRERSTRTGGLTSSATWSLVALITTNKAQRDMVAATSEESSAIQYRMLEINVEDVAFTQEQVAAYETGWADVQRDCAGAMGALIQYAICKRGVARMNREVLAFVRKAAEILGAKQDARFQYRALGAMLYLQAILREEGVEMFDSRMLVKTFKAAFADGLGYVAANILPTDGVSLLAMCLSDLRPSTLITENETSRHGGTEQYDMILNSRTPDVVNVRHIKDLRVSWLSSSGLRTWAHERKISERDLLHDCRQRGVMTSPNKDFPGRWTEQYDLFKGTRDAGATRQPCYRIDIKKLNALTGTEWEADDEPAPRIKETA